MLVFEERGKLEHPEKNLSEQRREPTTNLTHIWRRRRDFNPGHIGWRRALSPLRHPLLPVKVHHQMLPLFVFNYFGSHTEGILIHKSFPAKESKLNLQNLHDKIILKRYTQNIYLVCMSSLYLSDKLKIKEI